MAGAELADKEDEMRSEEEEKEKKRAAAAVMRQVLTRMRLLLPRQPPPSPAATTQTPLPTTHAQHPHVRLHIGCRRCLGVSGAGWCILSASARS